LPADFITSYLSAKSSIITRACGSGLVLTAVFFSFTSPFCLAQISSRAGSSHSEWKELSFSPLANSRTGSQAESISMLGLNTCTASYTRAYGPRSNETSVVVLPPPLGARKHPFAPGVCGNGADGFRQDQLFSFGRLSAGLLPPEPPGSQSGGEESREMCIDHRDRLKHTAPVGPLLFTYPPNCHGLQEPLCCPQLIEQVVPRAVLLSGSITEHHGRHTVPASAASFLAQRGAGISHQ
jgi:hypothetical protein